MTDRTVTWLRIGDRYLDLKDERDSFLALDGGDEIGIVKLVESGPDTGRWMWSMVRIQPGPALPRPTNGTALSRDEAARELIATWRAFRGWFEAEE